MSEFYYCIYHNPKCSKSRKSLELLKIKTNNYETIEYLKTGLSKTKLKESIRTLDVPFHRIVREKEPIFKNMKINLDSLCLDNLINLIIQNPVLLQRPMVTKFLNLVPIKTIICRPPDKINFL